MRPTLQRRVVAEFTGTLFLLATAFAATLLFQWLIPALKEEAASVLVRSD
jgi:hypothetical protein